MKFYELTKAYLQVMDLSEEMDQQTLSDTLESIEEQFETKAENIVKLTKLNQAEIDAIKLEVDRLNARKKALENQNTNLENYLYHHMTTAKINKVKSTLFTISIAKKPPSVGVVDESKIPAFYFKQKVEHVLDKKDLLKDLKEGQEIEGVQLVQGTRLSIK